jgi:hypothetical protein
MIIIRTGIERLPPSLSLEDYQFKIEGQMIAEKLYNMTKLDKLVLMRQIQFHIS